MKEVLNSNIPKQERVPTFEELKRIADTYYPDLHMSDEALKILIESKTIKLDPFDIKAGGLKIHSEEDGI